jgi:hypothetical protein
MRRSLPAVLLCTVLLVLAGCQAPGATSGSPGAGVAGSPTADLGVEGSAPADPSSDRLGWENGYWHNESLDITTNDGLNESERAAVIARSMARVEHVRGLEFEESVPVEVISRDEYRQQAGGEPGESLRRFDNAKFESLFLVGEDQDSIAVQNRNRGESVLGYYSSRRGAIVIVSDAETPTISERTLGHELVNALQDQQFGLGGDARTRDAVQGQNGIIEGDAVATTQEYSAKCGQEWECLAAQPSAGGDRHFGINFMLFFPYSDGPGLVNDLRDRGGWTTVNDAYDDYPDSAVEVTYPDRYPEWEPRDVRLQDRTSNDWEHVRPSSDRNRPDYAVPGPSAIAASMAYTLADDYNESSVVDRQDIINYRDDGSIDRADPYNYDLPATDGWRGGRMHVYSDGDELAYVWRTNWESRSDAREFARAWEGVIQHWGGTETDDGTWVIAEDSPFTDAIRITVDGNRVTVVNAPSESELSEVHGA